MPLVPTIQRHKIIIPNIKGMKMADIKYTVVQFCSSTSIH